MPFWEVEECSPRSFITALLLKEEPIISVTVMLLPRPGDGSHGGQSPLLFNVVLSSNDC
jgi:hypothetical protein